MQAPLMLSRWADIHVIKFNYLNKDEGKAAPGKVFIVRTQLPVGAQ